MRDKSRFFDLGNVLLGGMKLKINEQANEFTALPCSAA